MKAEYPIVKYFDRGNPYSTEIKWRPNVVRTKVTQNQTNITISALASFIKEHKN